MTEVQEVDMDVALSTDMNEQMMSQSNDSNCCPAHLDPCLPFGTGTNGIAKGDGIQFHLDNSG